MTKTPNAVAAKGGQMAIRRLSAILAPYLHTEQVDQPTGKPVVATKHRPSKLVRRLLALACLGMLVADTTGCTITRGVVREVKDCDCVNDFMVSYRNRSMAEKAWHCRKDRFGDQINRKEFKEGFIDGYLEIATGGPGCCPTIAPSKYWGWQYQSSNGQAGINAWFAGYPMGVQAAEQDGIGHYQEIFTVGGPGAVGSGAACSSCQNGVAAPMYQGGEMVPAPVPQTEMQMEGEGVEMVIPPTPDAALYSPNSAAGMDSEPALIASRGVELDGGMIDAQLTDNTIQFSGPMELQVDELESIPSSPAVDELPFTFE